MTDSSNEEIRLELMEMRKMFNSQFATLKEYMNENFASKEDLAQTEKRIVDKLTKKIDSSHSINIKHHLETRAMLGDLQKQFTEMKEGLAKAGNSLIQIT